MPAERVSMRRVREILRLKHACGSSDRAIARSLGIARSTVALTLERLAAAGLAWPLPEALSDRVLEGMLCAGTGTRQGLRRKGGAGVDPCPSRAASRRRHAHAALGGVPRRRAGWLCLQPLVRALPCLGGAAVADDAAIASGGRTPVRRLCRPDGRDRRRPERRGA